MYSSLSTFFHVEHDVFGFHLFVQQTQKILGFVCGFRLKEHKRTHVFNQNINIILNKVFLHKKVDVHFYMGRTVFFSWGLNL